MLRILPTAGAQIDIGKIVSFILNLRNWGFNLLRVTFDGFQSAHAIQQLNHAGALPEYQYSYLNERYHLESQVLSVDRTDVPYTVLRDHFNYGAISYYEYAPFISEAVRLEHDIEKRKVDHPKQSSKDIADALCGAVFSCVTHRLGITQEPIAAIMQTQEDSLDVETVSNQSILPDMGGRIIGIIPPPLSEANPDLHRARLGNRGGLIDELARIWRRGGGI
jgi:hypothetical protein